jgi:hypothetical protein
MDSFLEFNGHETKLSAAYIGRQLLFKKLRTKIAKIANKSNVKSRASIL